MQHFQIDQQTIDDLELFSKEPGSRSIFSYFDLTTTIGGRDFLLNLFKTPINDMEELRNRSKVIKHLLKIDLNLNLNRETLDFIEFYLRQNDKPEEYSTFRTGVNILRNCFNRDQSYYIKQRGVNELLNLLISAKDYFSKFNSHDGVETITQLNDLLIKIFSNPAVRKYSVKRSVSRMIEVEKCDFALRGVEFNNIRKTLDILYKLDAFLAVAKCAKSNSLSFPSIDTSNNARLELEGAYHLFLEKPVFNDFALGPDKHLSFITGPNMAGKSTLIKTIAICTYLAHLGFPVPASKMEMTAFNGLLTTINISDDLKSGHSFFYSEVLRVKTVAEKISDTDNMLIIFDELFKGTNVKDAYEASLSIIEQFSQITDNLFIISSHIVEVAERLAENKKISFKCFKAYNNNSQLLFDYKLHEGLSHDRVGYLILKNEKVSEILQKKIDHSKINQK